MMSSDECECGVLKIDWRTRAWSVQGIGGHDNDLMTAEEVHAKLSGPLDNQDDVEQVAVVVWPENGDGLPQLCFYDLKAFEREVFQPEGGERC